MNPPPSGRIILVGEGDFSFAVAYTLQSDSPSRIVATSYDNEESIMKHKGAENNIEKLKQLGASVVVGVDATNLHQNDQLKSGGNFACIIFNFPHVGGKSNIKKNRNLIKEFFISAVQVLEPDGKICMSLCRGQGGTPADNPRRDWPNTWQVVAMAAYGGLVLKEVQPFSADDYPEYASTGFRSRDQWFHTNGALTHVFVKSLPNTCDVSLSHSVAVDGKQYLCRPFIAKRVNRKLHKKSNHPVNAIVNLITQQLSKDLSFELVKETSPIVQHWESCVQQQDSRNVERHYVLYWEGSQAISGEELEEKEWVGHDQVKRKHEEKGDEGARKSPKLLAADDSETDKKTNPVDRNVSCDVQYPKFIKNQLKALGLSNPDPSSVHVLRTSLLENFSFVNLDSKADVTVHVGDVFERCPVSENRYPVRHEMLAIVSKNLSKTAKELVEIILASFPQELRKKFKVVSRGSEDFERIATDGFLWDSKMCQTEMIFGTEYYPDLTDLKAYEPCSTRDTKIMSEDVRFNLIGYVGQLYSPEGELDGLYFVLDVDKVTKEMLKLRELRILWSEDDRIFDAEDSDSEQDVPKITVLSLYPIKHRHDVTFWENKHDEFDELLFYDCVRNIADDNVKSVTLVNEFDHNDYGHSRCYRHIYQSCDRALPYHMSHDLQNGIRLRLEAEQGITLR